MIIGQEDVRTGVSEEQVRGLIDRLDENGFEFSGLFYLTESGFERFEIDGWIGLKERGANYPKADMGVDAPMGFILKVNGGYKFQLLNAEMKFPGLHLVR